MLEFLSVNVCSFTTLTSALTSALTRETTVFLHLYTQTGQLISSHLIQYNWLFLLESGGGAEAYTFTPVVSVHLVLTSPQVVFLSLPGFNVINLFWNKILVCPGSVCSDLWVLHVGGTDECCGSNCGTCVDQNSNLDSNLDSNLTSQIKNVNDSLLSKVRINVSNITS